MSNNPLKNSKDTNKNKNKESSFEMEPESKLDWGRFKVRFLFGFLPGALLGFGFWTQMCRPLRELGAMESIPRLITELLHLGKIIDSGLAGIIVTLIFALALGLIVAAWPHISKYRSER
ncbi:MAG: hypothetical protein PF692_02560 [Kiritimatiellae bacterium]|jgi:hypothetical protein|nr:hypothetical protein [Kiritimatiellia bacterium]